MSYVFVGMGLMAFLSASMLAIDVGMLMTARNQAQNSADAGALAGATALVYDDFSDHSDSGPAATSALAGSRANQVMRENVDVRPADVEFLNDASGAPNRVKVTVFRQSARGNPVSTLIASFFGMATADIAATATAEASGASSVDCPMPFTIPDRWIERQTGTWDTTDTFTAYPKNPSLQPDVYRPVGDGTYSGYDVGRDRGTQLVIRTGGTTIGPNFYFPLRFPGSAGSTDWQNNAESCPSVNFNANDPLTMETTAIASEMSAAMNERIAQDPGAYWDTAHNKVVSDQHPSPRLLAVPVYDPMYYDTGKKLGHPADLKVGNFIGFFVESVDGSGNVTGRITPIVGTRRSGTPPLVGMFPRSIRLVQ